MSTSLNLIPKMWDVKEQDNTKLGQDNSLVLVMGLTW
jgi:hypothetical protein